MYINCKSYFSLRYGTFSTQDLVKKATELGVAAMALTNINATCDAWEFVKLCSAENIMPILGVEIRNGDSLLFILLAKNNKGFFSINKFLSEHLTKEKSFPEFATSVIHDCYIIYPLGKKTIEELLENEFIGVLPNELTKIQCL